MRLAYLAAALPLLGFFSPTCGPPDPDDPGPTRTIKFLTNASGHSVATNRVEIGLLLEGMTCVEAGIPDPPLPENPNEPYVYVDGGRETPEGCVAPYTAPRFAYVGECVQIHEDYVFTTFRFRYVDDLNNRMQPSNWQGPAVEGDPDVVFLCPPPIE